MTNRRVPSGFEYLGPRRRTRGLQDSGCFIDDSCRTRPMPRKVSVAVPREPDRNCPWLSDPGLATRSRVREIACKTGGINGQVTFEVELRVFERWEGRELAGMILWVVPTCYEVDQV